MMACRDESSGSLSSLHAAVRLLAIVPDSFFKAPFRHLFGIFAQKAEEGEKAYEKLEFGRTASGTSEELGGIKVGRTCLECSAYPFLAAQIHSKTRVMVAATLTLSDACAMVRPPTTRPMALLTRTASSWITLLAMTPALLRYAPTLIYTQCKVDAATRIAKSRTFVLQDSSALRAEIVQSIGL